MSALKDILINLQEQVSVYRRLLDLSQAQFKALQAKDVHSVHAILQEIELGMIDRSRVEQRRGVVLAQVAGEMSLPVEELTLTALSQHGDQMTITGIRRCSEELQMLIAELDVLVDKNRALLEEELALIDHLVKGMTHTTPTQTYGQGGSKSESAERKLLDMQV